jgi:hypothetical protein
VRAQRWILIVAIVLGVGYMWLRGGFVGLGVPGREPSPAPAASAGSRAPGGAPAPPASTEAVPAPAAAAPTAAAPAAPAQQGRAVATFAGG